MRQVNWYPHEDYIKAIRGKGTEIVPEEVKEKPKKRTKKKKEVKEDDAV